LHKLRGAVRLLTRKK